MSENLLAARLRKTAQKSMWTVLSTGCKSDAKNIHALHTRDVGKGPNELEFVKKYAGTAFIEPEFGYVISQDGYLIDESLYSNDVLWFTPWRVATCSPTDFLKARGDESRIIKVPAAISLRFIWEWNFYHFYADVLGKIKLFDEIGLDPSIPLVIGKYYDDLPFVRQIIHEGAFGKREWIVQRDKYVQADEIYYCRNKQDWMKKLDYIPEQMGITRSATATGKRIFLTRPQSGPRHIINNADVVKLVSKYNFETVDFTGAPVADQIELLNNTRHLIAIHGAGMINIIFRRGAPMSVIAIESPIYRTTDFENISKSFGYHWIAVLGHSPVGSPQHSSFKVDLDVLEAKIIEALATE